MGSEMKADIVIIGSGPTGLGAAARLHQHAVSGGPKKDWLLLDAAEEAGGLACTDVTPEGFLFDMGGHVIFSHFDYFDELLDAAIGAGDGSWNQHERVSYVRIKGRYVAYPFQNNVSALDKPDQIKCLTGLVDAQLKNALAQERPRNFDEWILRTQGEGLAELFMRPYNFKVWAIPTHLMQCEWLGERVATANVHKAIANVINGEEDAGWGPNATFRFPKEGGTGAIWKGVSRLLPAERQRYGSEIVALDHAARTLTLKDGTRVSYGSLVTTMPLDLTLRMCGRPDWADGLTYSSSHIIGIGIRGTAPHGKKCWLYYPEDNCPFYRCTVFSHYADANVPAPDARLRTLCHGDGVSAPRDGGEEKPGPYWSLMFEVSESKHKPVNWREKVALGGGAAGEWPRVVLDTIVGSVATELMAEGDEIVSIYHRRLEHGYPTPSLGRNAVLDQALPWLKEQRIWSRGRFGSYKVRRPTPCARERSAGAAGG